jgi:di/tricarboxylate transporter
MTPDITLLLVIIGVALVLFAFEWFPTDVIALGILITLILTGLVPSDQAFLGFGSDAVIMILGLLILTAALTRTGVVEMAGRWILRGTGQDAGRVLLIIVIASAVLGAFMSNTASTAFFVPITIGLAGRSKISASKLLMPIAFASILTSSVTLISTSTNLIVSDLLTRYDQPPMGMFELAPVGIPVAVVGVIYMLTIGKRLIPDRSTDDKGGLGVGERVYLTEIMILPDSDLIGKTLAESGLRSTLDLNVVRIVRDKTQYLVPDADTGLKDGDVLLVEGRREDILKVKDLSGLDIKADVKLSDPSLQTEEVQLAEAIILPGSPLIGRTLKGFHFRERYGLQVLAIHRRGATLRRKMSLVALRVGDILLIQGGRDNIATLNDENIFRVLGTVERDQSLDRARAPLAIAIFVGSLLAATFNIFSLPVAVLVGTLLVFLTRCITPEEAYREVEWKAIILIGCMLALGVAMEHTGTALYLAQQFVNITANSSPVWLLAAFFVLTVILTQPMSNQAAAVVVLPVAIQTALQIGLNPRTFAMMIAIAASCSYLTPLEPSCLMVYGPGRYRFFDFVKVGSLLTVVIFVIAILLVPLVWPL